MTTITANSIASTPEAAAPQRTTRDLITVPVICIYLWTFIHIGRPQDVFPFLKAINPGDVAAGLSILTFLFRGEKDLRFFSLPETRLFLVFLLIALVSTPFSVHRGISVFFLIGFFGKTGLYLYIATKLLTSKRRIDGLIKTIMLSGFLMALATLLAQQPGIRAAIGTTYDPNDMAMLMVITIPLALTQGLATSNRHWKIICYSCVVLCLLTIIATMSRGGFLGLLAVSIYILKTRLLVLSKKKLLLIVLSIGAVFLIFSGQDFMARMSSILEDVSSRRAGSGRILVWQRALVLAADHPLLGVGPNCFYPAYGRYLMEGKFLGELAPLPGEWAPNKWSVAHSAYLTVLAELGLIGFIVYMAFIVNAFRNINSLSLSHAPENERTRISFMLSGLKISLIGVLICSLFLSTAYSPLFYLYFFISGNMKRIFSFNQNHE
jgi:probable O-glycosylation ligase (exosortase A-associated)